MAARGRKNTTALISLIVAIFAFWWGISVLDQTSAQRPSAAVQPATELYAASGPILIQHKLVDGIDTYSGSLSLPSSCDTLGTGIATVGTSPQHVTILFTINRTAGCAAAAGNADVEPFAVSLSRSKEPPMFDGATVNGVIEPTRLSEGS